MAYHGETPPRVIDALKALVNNGGGFATKSDFARAIGNGETLWLAKQTISRLVNCGYAVRDVAGSVDDDSDQVAIRVTEQGRQAYARLTAWERERHGLALGDRVTWREGRDRLAGLVVCMPRMTEPEPKALVGTTEGDLLRVPARLLVRQRPASDPTTAEAPGRQ